MFRKTLSLMLITVLALSCLNLGSARAQDDELQGTITISGAFALFPMVVTWGEEFEKLHPKVDFDISAGGAGKGIADVLGGLVDIGMVSREIFQAEIDKGAFWVAVTKDAVFPMVNIANPVLAQLLGRGVAVDTLAGIWIEGSVTTWGQVVDDPAVTAPIDVFTRSDASGAAQVWAEFLGDHAQEELLGTAVFGDPGLAEAVARDPLGIGYNNLNFAYDPTTQEPVALLAVLPIDFNTNGQVDPEEGPYGTRGQAMEAVSSGAYPSPPARELNLVTLNKPTGLVRAFIEWVLTDGQQFVEETGFIPLGPQVVQAQLDKLD